MEGGREAQASDLLQLMADYLDINYDVASETFALWLISPLLGRTSIFMQIVYFIFF